MRVQWKIVRGDFDRRRLLAYIAITSIFTVLGPFGTYEAMSFAPRLAYWALVNAGVAVFMTFAGDTLFSDGLADAVPRPVKASLAAALGTIGGSGVVWLAEVYIRGSNTNPIHILIGVFAVGLMMMIVRFHLWRPPARPYAKFFKRLPPELGTDLVSLSMADHYVEVRTTRNTTMVLMRFADAMSELANYPGERIHRSHWVAADHMAKLVRDGGRHVVVLDDGTRLPVSKAYLKPVRDMLDRKEQQRLDSLAHEPQPSRST